MSFFKDIPEMRFEPFHRVDGGDKFRVALNEFTNTLIYENFPFVASLSLKAIHDELKESLDQKRITLRKLKEQYKKTMHANIMSNIIINDFEMADADNAQLVPNAHSSLLSTADDLAIVNVVMELAAPGYHKDDEIDKSLEEFSKLLRFACDYTLPRIYFKNTDQTVLAPNTIYCISQVWLLFDQYFKQFDYLDYLKNYFAVRSVDNNNTKRINNIIRILVNIGPINNC